MVLNRVQVRAQLEQSIRDIVDAVGGAGSCTAIGYTSGGRDHSFWVVVDQDVKGALVGSGGHTATCLRVLIRSRASVLGCLAPVDLRVIGHEDEAPTDAFQTTIRETTH